MINFFQTFLEGFNNLTGKKQEKNGGVQREGHVIYCLLPAKKSAILTEFSNTSSLVYVWYFDKKKESQVGRIPVSFNYFKKQHYAAMSSELFF